MDDATVEILLKWKQENEYVVKEVMAQLAALDAQSKTTSTSGQGLLQALPGPTWWAGLALAIAATVVVLWPFAMLIGSAAVALTSFAVAGAGFIAIAALVAGAFAAIGGAVLALGGGGGIGAAAALTTSTDKLASAKEALVEFNKAHTGLLTILQQQQKEQLVENIAKAQVAYNDALARSQGPVGVLLAQLTVMKDVLAAQAAPLAALITQWVAGAIPGVTALGQAIMTWFGERLPGVLAGISKVIKDLTPDFLAFGQYVGGVMDKIGPLLAPMAEAFARLAIQGAKGLLDNLVRLSEWFVKELPNLGPIVAQIFGQMGRFIQWVADNWANLTDFVIKNWGPTVANAQTALRQLNEWWQANGDTIKTFGSNLVILMQGFNNFLPVALKFLDVMTKITDIIFASRPTKNNMIHEWIGDLQTAVGLAERFLDLLHQGLHTGGTPAGSGAASAAAAAARRQRGFA